MFRLIGSGAVIAALLASVLFIYNNAVTAPQPGSGEFIVEIKRGDTVKNVAERLSMAGVITSQTLFSVEAKIWRLGSKLKAGEYLLNRGGSIRDSVRVLASGKCYLRQITAPEGIALKQIGELLEKQGITTAQEFHMAADNPALLKKFNIPAHSAEGYLFPDTYGFTRQTPADAVVAAMVKNFFQKIKGRLPDGLISDPEKLHEIVTMASIIEKETGAGKERKLIASVFYNRLKIRMPLQSDPTVIYGLPGFDGNIRKGDLSYDSPYNTYKYGGLPPGPIASPGIEALEAAVNPADSGYLYFVSMNNGEHFFSKTLDEHNGAVRRYQLARVKPGK